MSNLLTIPEIETATRLSRSSILRLIAKGDLRVLKIGRSVRVTADELDRFIRERQSEAAAR